MFKKGCTRRGATSTPISLLDGFANCSQVPARTNKNSASVTQIFFFVQENASKQGDLLDQFDHVITTSKTLYSIAKNCPRSLSTFIHIKSRVDNRGKVTFQKKEIMNDLSESFAKFRNDIRALAREDLLEWHQMGDYLHITLAAQGPENDGD